MGKGEEEGARASDVSLVFVVVRKGILTVLRVECFC